MARSICLQPNVPLQRMFFRTLTGHEMISVTVYQDLCTVKILLKPLSTSAVMPFLCTTSFCCAAPCKHGNKGSVLSHNAKRWVNQSILFV
jgi:hypothetical protein